MNLKTGNFIRINHKYICLKKSSEERPCVSKQIMITFTILAVIFIIGIIVAVFITIFVGRSKR